MQINYPLDRPLREKGEVGSLEESFKEINIIFIYKFEFLDKMYMFVNAIYLVVYLIYFIS